MKLSKLDILVKKIRDKRTRWDGLVELKELSKTNEDDRFIHYCDDSFWLIRWAVIEKIGELRLVNCLDTLFKKLADNDKHVKRNAQKAIIRCLKENIKPIINKLDSRNHHINVFCKSFIIKHLDTYQSKIQEQLFYSSWITANQLLHIIFVVKKEKSETLLIKATKIKTTQKHAIMMLSLINSKKAIAHYISLFSIPSLKRHIIQAIKMMDPSIAYPLLLKYLEMPKIKKTVQAILIKCGKPSLPYIIQMLHQEAIRSALIECLYKMPLTKTAYRLLERKVNKYPIITKTINLNSIKPK